MTPIKFIPNKLYKLAYLSGPILNVSDLLYNINSVTYSIDNSKKTKMQTKHFVMKDIPHYCECLMRVLSKNGFESYLVGGCVRDSYMEYTPKDYDVCTNALPDQVIQLFEKLSFVKNIDLTGKSFGVVRVKTTDGNEFEFATYRSETYDGKTRQPQTVEFKTDVKDDLSRRDFTINALIYDPFKMEIYDYFDGLSDIDNGIIRCVGNLEERFKEDPLRILRAVRFKLRFNFKYELALERYIFQNLNLKELLPFERISEEVRKIFLYQDRRDYMHEEIALILKNNFFEEEWEIPIYLFNSEYVYYSSLSRENRFMYWYTYAISYGFNRKKYSFSDVEKSMKNKKFSSKEIEFVKWVMNFSLFYSSIKDFHASKMRQISQERGVALILKKRQLILEQTYSPFSEIKECLFKNSYFKDWNRYCELDFVKASLFPDLSGKELGEALAKRETLIFQQVSSGASSSELEKLLNCAQV